MGPLRETLLSIIEDAQAADILAQEVIRRNVKLRKMARGCETHRSYRGLRKPTGDCADCLTIYTYRKEMNL